MQCIPSFVHVVVAAFMQHGFVQLAASVSRVIAASGGGAALSVLGMRRICAAFFAALQVQ